jgi:pimeloyl-ACP methyl ester carboxylesterase
MTRPTLVLVHGAWHPPATFDLLRGELDTLGYATHAVNRPTTGPDPRGGLTDDADAIRRAVDELSGPVAVVAHSYGGLPATQALDDIEHLIYLASYVPDVGESLYSLHGVPDPVDSEGLFPIPADPRAEFYADLSTADGDLAVGKLVAQRHQPFVDRVTRAAWHTVPSTYILAEQDKSLPVELQERMSARTKAVHRMATSHSPHLSRAAELAALLDRILQG